MCALPSRYVSWAKYSAKLRVPLGQAVPSTQMAPVCTTPVAAAWENVGVLSKGFWVCAMNTFQSAPVSRLLEAPVPHQTMSSLPAAPALTQGARAVLVPEPLLTRAGAVQVPPRSAEPTR